MTQKAIYNPEPLFGIDALQPEPIECEIIEHLPDGMVRIHYSVPENALIFILGGVPKEQRKSYDTIRDVLAEHVHIVQ